MDPRSPLTSSRPGLLWGAALLAACTAGVGGAGGALTPGDGSSVDGGEEAGEEEGAPDDTGEEEGGGEEEGTSDDTGGEDGGEEEGGDEGGTDDTGTSSDDSPLSRYAAEGDTASIEEISANLSGIAWNPVTGTLLGVLDSNRRLFELSTDLEVIREIALEGVSHNDTEDIVWLGQESDGSHTYAIVAEDSSVVIGTVPFDGSETLDLSDWQEVIYDTEPENRNAGGEGLAYDRDTGTFYACKERDPMQILSFSRPSTTEDVSYEDGGVVTTEPFDADALLAAEVDDISSCLWDARTDRLLVLSHESHRIIDVDTAGTVHGELDLRDGGGGLGKPEGIAVLDDDTLVVVGEPNEWRRYAFAAE